MIKYLFALLSLFFSGSIFAASFSSFTCPNSYLSVKEGDTMQAVTAACGQPTSVITRQDQVNTPVTSTVWVYTLGSLNIKGVSLYLPTLSITFDNNQNVSAIYREGSPGLSTGFCGIGKTVKIGDSENSVLSACGQPSFVNSEQTTSTTNQTTVEWTYNYGPYKPQIILDFQNGILKNLSSGPLGN